MRVGFVCERMLTGFGVDLAVDRLAAGLSERGHEVTVYCSVDDGTYRKRPYRTRLIPVTPSRFFPAMERRARKWARLLDLEGLDAVEIHTFPFFRLIPMLSTPVVAVDHGVSPTDGMPWWLKADFDYVRRRLYGAYLPRAKEVVTISEFLRGLMPRGLGERAQVIQWGSDHYYREVSEDEIAGWRRSLGVDPDIVLSMYVGRLNQEGQPYKGVKELLDMFSAVHAENQDAALLCVGFGDEHDARLIRKAGAIAVLKAPPEVMPVAYAAADVMVTASTWEGFGLPLLEAQRAGLPAVAYRKGAHPEVCLPGQSALLVDTQAEFQSEWLRLVGDKAARVELGDAAREFASGLTWDHAIDRHEKALQKAAGQPASVASTPQDPGPRALTVTSSASSESPLVSVVVLAYKPEAEDFGECLDSILASSYPNIELVVVDNGSGDGTAEEAARARGAIFVQTGANLGFSGGINRGVDASTGSLIFILNPDTRLDPDCVGALVDTASRRPTAIGFAPKMLFLHDNDLIDSVGVALDEMGAAFNRGIGQLDIGQYDREELVMGACFGAAMIRREAFQPLRVGPLDERYFMYYEDVDWCLRATLLGEDFWTSPRARVYHVHSGTTRLQAFAFKYRLIERNLLFTVFKNTEKRRAMKIFYHRTRSHLRNILRGQFPLATARVLVEGWLGVARYWGERHVHQRRRVRADVDWIKLGNGERPYFNPVSYSPVYGWPTLLAMVKRLWLVTGEQRWERSYAYLVAAETSTIKYRPSEALSHLQRIAAPLPPPLVRFFKVLDKEPGMNPEDSAVPVELQSDLGPGGEATAS